MGIKSTARRALETTYDRIRVNLKPKCEVGSAVLLANRSLSLTMRQTLYRKDYEQHELRILQQVLRAGDRVMELGSGMGLLSIVCAKKLGDANVATFEGNPEMEPIIRANYDVNGVNPSLTMAMVGPAAGQAKFHIRPNFWASSSHDGRAEGSRTVIVPVRALDDELARFRPNFLIVDIEGGEKDLFDLTELSGVRKLLIEVHPDLITAQGVTKVLVRLASIGFAVQRDISTERELFLARS